MEYEAHEYFLKRVQDILRDKTTADRLARLTIEITMNEISSTKELEPHLNRVEKQIIKDHLSETKRPVEKFRPRE